MADTRPGKSLMRIIVILLALGGAADATALLIVPAALNGNEVLPALGSGPNKVTFAVQFHTLQSLQFDVFFESTDDPFSPIALTGLLENLTVVPWTGLTMTLGGGATLTEIGDAMPTALVNAFARGNVADFTFDPEFTVNAFGLIGGTNPWLINTHGARVFRIRLSPTVPPAAAAVPEPAAFVLVLIGLASLSGARRRTRRTRAAQFRCAR